MKTTTKNPQLVLKALGAVLAAALCSPSAFAATFIWDGGPGGSGTDLGVAANWSPDGIPNGATTDILRWNGTVAGTLSLAYTTQQTGLGASSGISFDITAAQTDALTIDGTVSAGLRVGAAGVSIASGAGAFTLGNGSGTFNMTVFNGTLTMNNNSANTATLSSDVTPATTSAGTTTWAFGGTGNWLVGCNLNSANSSGNIVTKSGAGTLTLTNGNTYNGTTTVTGGTLALATRGTIGSTTSPLTVNGGTVDLGGFTRTNGTVTLTSGTLSNGIQRASTLTANNSGLMTIWARLDGPATLTKTGAGTLTLSGANNTYSGGTTIGTGQGAAVLRAAATQALGSGTIQTDSGGNASTARLELTGGISLNNAVTLFGRTSASVGIQSLGGNNTLSGAITVSSGGSIYQIQSDADTLTLGTAAATAITAASGSRVVTLQGAGNGSVVGNIINGGGTVGLTKSGAGTWTLSGANSYTLPTVISQGTLALSGSATLASPQVSVVSGAILDVSGLSSTFTLGAGQALTNGTGAVNGNFTTASGSSIYPATVGVAGALTFNNNLSLAAGGTVDFDLSTSAGSGNDQVVVGGNLTLGSANTLRLRALSGATPLDETGDYVLFAVSGTSTMATVPTLVWEGTTPANYLNFALQKVGENIVLKYTSGSAPTVTASVNPSPASRNQAVKITAEVVPGSGGIASVTANLTPVGGSSAVSLVHANANVYTNTFIVSAATTTGVKSLTVTVTDDTSPTPFTASGSASLTVDAASRVWDGGSSTDDNWTSNENWTGDTGPGLAGDSVTFAGTSRLTPNLDASYSVTGLAFDNLAGSFTLGSGNSSTLTLTAGTGIVNSSANAQTVNVPVVLAVAQTVNAGGDVTLGGPVTGAGGLTKTGNGMLTLAGNVTSGGGLTFNGGTSVVAAVLAPLGAEIWVGDSPGNTGALNIASGATVTASNWVAVGRNSANGTLNINGGTLIKQTTAGNLTTAGIGTTQTGTINLNGGVISNAVSETWIGETGTGVYNQTAGTAYLGAALRISYLASSGYANVSGGMLTAGLIGIGDGTSASQPGTGILSISGGAVVNATNGLRLGFAGNSSKFGYLTNNGGTLNVSGGDGMVVTRWDATRAHVIHLAGAINLLNNASLTFGQSGNTGEGSFTQSGGTLTFFSDGGVTAGGSGSVDLRGGGGGAYTYHLNGGTLTTPRVQKSGASGSGTFNFNGGTLKATGTSATFLQGLTRANVRNGGAIFDTGNFAVTVAQALLHSNVGGDADTDGGLTKLGTGSLILSGPNTFTGPVDVQAGEIQIGNATALGTTNSGTTVADGAQLAIYSSLVVQEPLTLNGVGTSGGAIRQGGNSTVTLGGPITLGSDAAIRIDGGCTVNVTNLVDTAGYTLTWLCDNTAGTISGEITGAGGFNKISAGAVTLSGANTYAGATTVSNGTLTLSGSIAAGGSVTVAGGILRGTGAIGSPVSVHAGGTLTAGAGAIGTLTINHDLSLAGTTSLKVNKAAGPVLTSDLITGVTTLNCGGTVTVAVTGDALAAGDEFTVFNAGAFSGAFTSITPAPGAGLAWDTVKLAAQGKLLVHANPVANPDEAGAIHGQTITIAAVKLLANDTGETGETLSVTGVSANASLSGGTITYTAPASGVSDVITYTLSDGRGGTAGGVINVALSSGAGGFNQLSATVLGNGDLRLAYLGIPGTNYALEVTHDLAEPVTWTPLQTKAAAANGMLIFTNTPSLHPTNDYYRTRYVP